MQTFPYSFFGSELFEFVFLFLNYLILLGAAIFYNTGCFLRLIGTDIETRMGYKPLPSQFHKPRLKLDILCSGLILGLAMFLSICRLETLAGGACHGVGNFRPVGPLLPNMKDELCAL